jgi:micrococcal nuclease
MFDCFTIKPWTFIGQTKKAKVIDIYDGDTCTIAMWIGFQRYSFKLRLYGIDTPELRTKNAVEKEAGYKAKDYLCSLILNKKVKIVFADKEEKFGRLLGTIFLGDKNINQMMISSGHAKEYLGGKKETFTN